MGKLSQGHSPFPLRSGDVPVLIVSEDESGNPSGFMGLSGQKVEMLFVNAQNRGKGIGRKLLEYGIEHYSVNELTVNEQNPLAKGFYEHMGFRVYKRDELDEQGNPYPILRMKRSQEAVQMSANWLLSFR